MNKALEEEPLEEGCLAAWHQELQDKVKEFPSWFPVRDDVIVPQWAVQVRAAISCREALPPGVLQLCSSQPQVPG